MIEKEEIRRRIAILRSDMQQSGIDLYLCVSTDPHMSEYVDEHDKVTEYFSGCTSDNAVLVVEEASARLWTDGRYFISAAKELADTGICLMKMGQVNVPEVEQYIASQLEKGMTLGFDGRRMSAADGRKYRKVASSCEAEIDMGYAPDTRLWIGRPALPCHPVWMLPEEYAGAGAEEKLKDVRSAMEEAGAKYFVLSKLDDIMWLLNIRGADVECNPVALSYLLVGPETVDLFLQKEEVTAELETFLREQRIKLHDYGECYDYIRDYHFEGAVLLDPDASSDAMLTLISGLAEVIEKPNPTSLMKSKKNPVEIDHIREVYERDSAALCRFIRYIKETVGKEEITEVSAAAYLDNLRALLPDYLMLSFPTISAYNANAAMAHYAATPENCSTVEPHGFLLVDSGGQYMGGTTDVTRTIAVGPLTEEMKRDFTLVAVSNLRLLDARFADGTCGAHLDMIAREPLFRYGLDFNHGTGHGIGYCLSVHEGPQRICRSVKTGAVKIEPGMIISDEPGIYKEGRYGIRTESIMLCVPDETTEFGRFYSFVPLTFAPIDLDAIDVSYMEPRDIGLLNMYHRRVFERIAPYLEGEDLEWLRMATRPVGAAK